MDHKTSIGELRESVIAEMVNRSYTISTIRTFRYNCNRFARYVQECGMPPEFTEAIGAAYLRDTFGYDERSESGQVSVYVSSNVNTIRKLGEYRLHGTFHTEIQTWTAGYDWAGCDKAILEKFIDRERESGKSENTIKARRHALRYFYEFLTAHGLAGAGEANGRVLSDFVHSRKGNSQNYIYNLLTGIRLYFRFLHHQGYSIENLEPLVPTMQRRGNLNVPAIWSEDELRQLIKSIDRSNPTGKRDYAILLMSVQLGIRVSDIAALKLSNLNFDHKTIEFTQQKTDKTVVYPMLDDVGWALIDWLRFGRADVDNTHVFLTCFGTPTEFAGGSAIGSILRRRMKMSGIRKEARNTTAGMHSIRHAVARRLVENDTNLYDIVSIMGHRNTNATSKYARTDIKGLRECALSVGV